MKYLGLLLIILGAIILILSYPFGWVDNNMVNGGALVLMIIGLIAHIILNKKYQD
jgi:membrane-bound ClpP family serine protease